MGWYICFPKWKNISIAGWIIESSRLPCHPKIPQSSAKTRILCLTVAENKEKTTYPSNATSQKADLPLIFTRAFTFLLNIEISDIVNFTLNFEISSTAPIFWVKSKCKYKYPKRCKVLTIAIRWPPESKRKLSEWNKAYYNCRELCFIRCDVVATSCNISSYPHRPAYTMKRD